MNDKDKEAFEKWWMEGFKGMSDIDVIKYKDVGKQTSLNGWQAACEYKQKEIDELIKQLKHEHDLYKRHLKVYEDENAKLRECVEFYANEETWFEERIIGYPIALDDEGGLARKVLKELNG